MTTDALDLGQLVRVRGQQWVVSDASRAALPTDELAAAKLAVIAADAVLVGGWSAQQGTRH